MPESTITAQVHESFDIHGNFGSKFPFDLEFAIDYLANAVDLSLGKIVGTGIRVDFEFNQNPIGCGSSDTVNVGQADFYPFASR
jgi:hypothetical protein